MKILVFLVLILCACNSYHLSGKEKKELKINPPGTVHLRDNLYIDRYEISNVAYREFIHWIQRESLHDYSLEKYLPDTLVWAERGQYELSQYYYNHPGFNDYPAIAISYEQAVVFCNWRSDRVNELLQKEKHRSFKFKKVRYRLPSREEWELAAANGLHTDKYPFGLEMSQNKIGDLIYYDWSVLHPDGYERAIPTIAVRSLYPNLFGAYNILGNVSEMISEKGIAKGGNFDLPLDSCKIKIDHFYTKPEAWLGFRCVCEIIE